MLRFGLRLAPRQLSWSFADFWLRTTRKLRHTLSEAVERPLRMCALWLRRVQPQLFIAEGGGSRVTDPLPEAHPSIWALTPSAAILAQSYGVWRSLVARFVRDEEVVGSNPATPTM